MIDIDPCCHNCKERYVGCHGKCETYKAAKDKQEAKKAKYIAAKCETKDIDEYKIAECLKAKRYRQLNKKKPRSVRN